MDKVERVKGLVEVAEKLPLRNEHELNILLGQVEVTIRKLFGESSPHLSTLGKIRFEPDYSRSSVEVKNRSWKSGTSKLSVLLHAMVTELELSDPSQQPYVVAVGDEEPQYSRRVFVVHGKDGEMKQAVARTLEKLDFKPVILHEQPGGGRTLFQKFTDYADVGFAVVLLSPDDMGYPSEESPDKAKPRARQNVVLELGYLLCKLPQGRVFPLLREPENCELPSDYTGVEYTRYDSGEGWRMKLVQGLKHCGYEVNADKLY